MPIARRLGIFAARSAPLYHWMDRRKAQRVFKNDALKALYQRPGLGRGISLTRNSHYNQDWDASGDQSIRLTLNQEKLAQRHKILPIDAEFWRYTKTGKLKPGEKYDPEIIPADRSKEWHSNPGGQFAEEFLIGSITPLHNYLTEIYYRHGGHDDETFLRALARYVKKWQIPLVVNPSSGSWKYYAEQFPTARVVPHQHSYDAPFRPLRQTAAARMNEAAWNELSYAQQKAYKAKHPTSKWRINKMSPEQTKRYLQTIKQTFRSYHKAQRGKEYKDFIGRPTQIGDAEHDRRTNFNIWRSSIKRALQRGDKVPNYVRQDYIVRTKLYEKHSNKAYEV